MLRAIEEKERGNHFLICGQVPIGELLAAPSAERLDGMAACLLNCSPEVRSARLRARGDAEVTLDDHVSFGEWVRRHFADPQYRSDVIRVESATLMRWDRWENWQSGDPRWPATIVNTDRLMPEEVARSVEAWARNVLERNTLSVG